MMPFARPVAYIRRSAKGKDQGDISREFQTAKVTELAGDDAARLVVMDGDWGKSASTDKTDQRLAFLDLLAQVERGEVSAIYAYASDRIARSVEWAARLLNACRRAGVPIVTSEGRFDPDNAMTDQLFYFQAMQNEGYSRQSSQKRKATVAIQKAEGRHIGSRHYGDGHLYKNPTGKHLAEDPAAVVQAFREAGSYSGTVRLLNERGIPSRRSHLTTAQGVPLGWTPNTVKHVLKEQIRRAKERGEDLGITLPAINQRGARPVAGHPFSRLLICPHDGSLLTTITRKAKGGRPTATYVCHNGGRGLDHPRPYTVPEDAILPWAREEAVRLSHLDADVDVESSGNMAELDDKTARVIDLYVEGIIDKQERNERIAAIEREREVIETVRRVTRFRLRQGVDWTRTPGEINAELRTIWRSIRLDPATMRPIAADWFVDPDTLVDDD